MSRPWIKLSEKHPIREGYYEVMYLDGTTDTKPFRIRPRQNILGFMTQKNVTHWR